jgi:transcription elongation factor Elf1
MKTCKRCGKTKPTTEFYAHKISADGLRAKCKACHNVVKTDYEDIEQAVEAYWPDQECFMSDFFTAMAKVYSEVGTEPSDSVRQLEYVKLVINREIKLLKPVNN